MKMPTLTIRNVEPDTHAFYREEAARNGRSMEEEVRQTLERHRQQNQMTGKDLLQRIRSRALAIGGADDLAEILDNTKREPIPKTLSFEE